MIAGLIWNTTKTQPNWNDVGMQSQERKIVKRGDCLGSINLRGASKMGMALGYLAIHPLRQSTSGISTNDLVEPLNWPTLTNKLES
jgi:hypothetical protein